MSVTNAKAIDLLNQALKLKSVISIECNNGDIVTVGGRCEEMLLRWGNSRWAHPSGKRYDTSTKGLAATAVAQCGRGNVARAARKVLASHA